MAIGEWRENDSNDKHQAWPIKRLQTKNHGFHDGLAAKIMDLQPENHICKSKRFGSCVSRTRSKLWAIELGLLPHESRVITNKIR
jgi:hypothetical protein